MTMIKQFVSMLLLLSLLVLAGCGGGGGGASAGQPFGGSGNGGTGSTPTPSATVTGIVVTLSAPTVPNTGTTTATATVTALDANNNAVKNAPVTLKADNNAVLTIQGTAGSVTNATGQLVATVGIGSDNTNRQIHITATSGSASGTAALNVVDSATNSVPNTIDVISASPSIGTAGTGVQISAFVKDANNNALSGISVAFKSDTGTLSSVSSTTNAAGLATATISAGADESNRNVTITVSAGSISNSIVLPISGTKLTLSGPTSLVLGSSASYNVVATDSNSNVIPGITITANSSLKNTLTAPAGTTTSNTGVVTFNYTAVNAGTDTLTFSGAGYSVSPPNALSISALDFSFVSPAASTQVPVNVAQTVQVKLVSGGSPQAGAVVSFAATGGTLSASSATTDASGLAQVSLVSASAGPVTVEAGVTVAGTTTTTTLPLAIVATVPASLILQISPTALGPNAVGSVANQAQVLAKVSDSAGNPVGGVTVNFSRLIDPSGGNLLQASASTNSGGVASTTYVSGPETTANNGVVLQGAVASAPAVAASAALSVNQAALFIALGSGNLITTVNQQTAYQQNWVAYVTDSNGIAVNAVNLTVKGIPSGYLTGQLKYNTLTGLWQYVSPIWRCRNEDANQNGILDAGEDDNGDGILWPGNVVAVSPSTVVTANGLATITLTYAESYAYWVDLTLTASATVAGTESKNSADFILKVLGADVASEKDSPANQFSPFGLLPTDQALATPGACTQIL